MTHININNSIIVDDDEEEQSDDLSSEFYDEIMNDYHPQEQQQIQVQVRILHASQLQQLGSGTIYYSIGIRCLEMFRNFKLEMLRANQVQFEVHDETEDIRVECTTLYKSTFTKKEVDKKIEAALKEQKYDHLFKLKQICPSISTSQLSEVFDVEERTVNNILKRVRENQSLTGNPRGRKEGEKRIVNRITILKVKEFVDNDPTITIKQIRSNLEKLRVDNDQIMLISESSISKILQNLGYSYKRITRDPVNRNTEMAIKKRKIWSDLFLGLVSEDVVFVFVDECGINRTQNRNYGHSQIGHACNITTEKIKMQNYTCVSSMAVGYGLYTNVFQGACDGERFKEYCRHLVGWIRQKIPLNRKVVIVMDNASIHGKGIHEIFWSHHIFLLKTIPYSPQCNGIEMVFSQVKAELGRVFGNQVEFANRLTSINLEDIETEFHQRAAEIEENYFQGSQQLMEDNVNMENYAAMNSTFNYGQQRLRELENEIDTRRENAYVEPGTTYSRTDPIDEEVFINLVLGAFNNITIPQTYHYYAHTIKVCYTCNHCYPLKNDSKFYRDFVIPDDEPIKQFYIRYKNVV